MAIRIPFTNIQWSVATVSRRLLAKGLLREQDLRPRLMDNLNKEATRYASKMAKKGKDITADDIEKEMKKDEEFAKLCKDVGISESYLRNIASGAFQRYKQLRRQ